jgi:hypothetical protein
LIVHRKRDYWIVVLTARSGESVPSVSPIVVREMVGPNVPVYFLKRKFAVYLGGLLPPGMHVQGGAIRVYRLNVRGDQWDHPLLRDPSGEYGQDILEELGAIFTPRAAGLPELSPEQRVLVLEHELKRAGQAHARELGVLRARYEACVLGTRGEEASPSRWLRRENKRLGRRVEHEMRLLIEAQWASFLPRDARRRYPLRSYRMASRFLSDVAEGVGKVSMDRVAWVCSLVIARFEPTRLGFESGPLKPSPKTPQLTREDGASAWWCDLRRQSTPGRAPRVIYWSHPEGVVELIGLGYPKDEAIEQRG